MARIVPARRAGLLRRRARPNACRSICIPQRPQAGRNVKNGKPAQSPWVAGATMCEAPPGLCTLPVWSDSHLCVNHIGLKFGRKVSK